MNTADLFAPAFDLGQVVATPEVMGLVERGLMLEPYLARHHAGDWGEVSAGDAAANDGGLSCGDRFLSGYSTPFGKIWIVTASPRPTGRAPACSCQGNIEKMIYLRRRTAVDRLHGIFFAP